MPISIPVGYGLMKFKYMVVGDAEPMITTLGFQSLAGSTLAQLEAAASALQTDWVTNVNGGATFPNGFSNWTWLGTSARVNTSSGTFDIESSAAVPGAGGASESVIVNTALLVKKRTGLGGRKQRGRMYVPPWNISAGGCDEAGRLSAGTLTSLTTVYNNFYAAASADALYDPVLLHSSPADSPTFITALVVDAKLASQRTRLRP